MPQTILKLSFVALPIWVDHDSIGHLSYSKLSLEDISISIVILSRVFLIVLPLTFEVVSV